MTVQTITASEMLDKMNKGEDLLILDVRNEEDYNDWKIEGKKITSINVPYFDFLDNENVADDRLSKIIRLSPFAPKEVPLNM